MSWDMNNLYEWTMLENLPVGSIERVKNSFQFKEHSTENGMKRTIQDIFLNLIFNIPKDNIGLTMIYDCYQEE